MLGAFGGIIFLVGMVMAFIGHRHMGESAFENDRTGKQGATPFMTFMTGLAFIGVGVIIMALALVNGDLTGIRYSDFISGSGE